MNQPYEKPVTEREIRPGYPWVCAALRAKDPHASLMGLDETAFTALLAELDAMRPPVVAIGEPGCNRWNVRPGAEW